MKRILSVILCLTTFLSAFAISTFADECQHNYVSEHFSETCIEREKDVYTCTECGDTYTRYSKGYDEPDGFYFLVDSTRSEDVLTVKVWQFNNPGLYAEKVVFSFDSDALELVSVENGDCWPIEVYKGLQQWNKNPFSVAVLETDEHSKNNGLFFTVTLRVKDDSLDYGVNLTYRDKDIVDWDESINYYVCRTAEIINLVGKNKLAPHTFTAETVEPTCTSDGMTKHTCSVCGIVNITDITPMIPHSSEFKSHITEPDFDNTGLDEYVCTVCGAIEEREVPVLEHYLKGDLNNDGNINAIDANLMTKILGGTKDTTEQEYDASDINCDGNVNAIDSNMMKRILLGLS